MKLTALEVENLGPHRSFSCTFSPKMTAVTGPNGSGKSTLMAAVRWCLSGELTLPGKLADARCAMADDRSRSFARLSLEVGGTAAEVYRGLKPAGRRLSCAGEVLDREELVQERLQKWLGLPARAAAELIFAPQWGMFSFLTESPAARAQSLGRLFQVDHIARCWEAVGDHLAETDPASGPDAEALRARLAEEQARLDRVNRELAALPVFDVVELDYAQGVVDHFRDIERARKELADVETRLAELSATILEHDRRLEDLDAELSRLGPDSAARQTELTAELNRVRVWKRAAQEAEFARTSLEQAELVIASTQPPEALEPWTGGDEELLYQLRRDHDWTRKFVSTFDAAAGCGTCPTCGTRKDRFLDRYDEAWQRLPGLTESLAEHAARYNAWLDYERELKAYERSHAAQAQKVVSLRERVAAATAALNELGPAPERSEAELRVLLDAAAAEAWRGNDLAGQRAKVQSVRVSAAAVRKEMQSRADSLRAVLSLEGDSIDLYETALDSLQQARETESRGDRLYGEASALGQTIASLTKDLAAADETRARLEKLSAWRADLQELRGALHRDKLQRIMVHQRLAALQDDINGFLSDLGVDYRISVQEDLSLRARFPDGRDLPAERLSGGQCMMLGLARRLAANAACAPEAGIVCLDEPTAGLDADSLNGLRSALSSLRHVAGRRGLQFVVVTHERSLLTLFDHVVDLRP